MKAFVETFIRSVQQLDHYERTQVKTALSSIGGVAKVCDLIESLWEEDPQCPHCGHEQFYKHGKQSGLQRYRCIDCKKTFNALTGTPLAHLHKKELWMDYMQCLLESRVLRDISGRMDVSTLTAFRWRHRFSVWLKNDIPQQLSGIVEADETYFRESEKGNRNMTRPAHQRGGDDARPGISADLIGVLTLKDRAGNSLEYNTGPGQLRADRIAKCLNGKIAFDSVVVSDGAGAYQNFCTLHHLDHAIVRNRPGERRRASFHIQHVNAFHGRLKGWINGHFRGVSTKHLDHYLWWRHELENRRISTVEEFLAAALGKFPLIS